MSQFSIPQLQPVATPTSQFVAPAIQQPRGNTANQLSQLSNALAQVDNTFQSVAQNRFQATKEASIAQANEEFQKARIQNTKDLKAAVDNGQIAQSDNPWFITQLRQDVAANEASDKVNQMKVDWESSPVRFSDDPQAVENWAKDQLDQTVQGKDAYESEAIAPIVQQGVGSLVSYHMDVRRQEREQERLSNLQDRLSSVMMSPDQSTAPAQVAKIVADAGMTMPQATIKELVVKSALASAEATGSDGVFTTLASIPDAATGKSLADMPDVQRLRASLPLLRMKRDNEYQSLLAEQQKRQEEQHKDAVTNFLFQQSGGHPERVLITPEIAQKAGMSFKDTIDINEKAASYGDSMTARALKQTNEQAQGIMGQLESDVVTGKVKFTDPEVTDAISRVAALAPSSAGQLTDFLYHYQEMVGRNAEPVFAKVSDPQVLADTLVKAATPQGMTVKDLIPLSTKLSHEDWTGVLHELVKPPSAAKLSDVPVADLGDKLADQITYAAAAKNGDGNDLFDYKTASTDPEVQGRIVRAKIKMIQTINDLKNSSDFQKLPRDQQSARINQAVDAAAVEFGGITDADRLKAQQAQTQKASEVSNNLFGSITPESTTANGVTSVSDGKVIGASTTLSDAQRAAIRNVSDKLDDSPRSLSNIYTNPFLGTNYNILKSDWSGPNSLSNNWNPPAFTSRESAYLTAYVRNARLLNGGTFQTEAAAGVNDPTYGGGSLHLRTDSKSADSAQSAKILFSTQRNELASIRKDIETQWINPKNQSTLLSLTSQITGLQQTGQEVPQSLKDQFQTLSDRFRLHDFLGVTAGVTPAEAKKDWHVLKQYPVATDEDGLKNLIPLIHQIVPESEIEGVFEAQRSLIARAQRLLQNGRYLP